VTSTAFVDGIASGAIGACRLIAPSAREDLKIVVTGFSAAGINVQLTRPKPADPIKPLPDFNVTLHLLSFGVVV
jgi:hypothetical protein